MNTSRSLGVPAAMSLAAVVAALGLAACNHSLGPADFADAPPSVAFKAWQPGPGDTCPLAVHQKYSTLGPDGKVYPTWHPPVDPETGCTFGHEHGRDPHGSNLYKEVGDIPLGYANEQLDTYAPDGQRHEDHYGHKYEWENDVPMRVAGAGSGVVAVKCDILYKLHQGTHSKDAFTNNLHELVYHARCTDGTELHMTVMAAIGTPGEFTRTCDGARVQVGPATPANSPRGGGQRVIPDISCVTQFMLVGDGKQSNYDNALHESWQQSQSIRTEDGRTIASIDPYFQVNSPSRFYDPGKSDLTGRPIDMCYFVETNGDRARGGLCASATQNGSVAGIVYDDPRSPFNGVRRFMDMNSLTLNNEGGNTVWYTDPFGGHAQSSPFSGSIRQFVASRDNRGLGLSGPQIGSNRNYGGPGVHPPN